MSRSGYTDDCENVGLWRGAVHRAIIGYRGQHLLRKLRDALDSMPVKRLIVDAIKNEQGEVCALGALDPNAPVYEAEELATHFGVARALAAEIVYLNDEVGDDWEPIDVLDEHGIPRRKFQLIKETPEERWTRMRAWVDAQILPEPPQDSAAVDPVVGDSTS
jgi:hypothetical protein